MKRKAMYPSDFLCLKCGNVSPVNRFSSSITSELYMLHCYCFYCKDITSQVELKDSSYALAKIEYKDKDSLNDTEKLVYSILKGKNE